MKEILKSNNKNNKKEKNEYYILFNYILYQNNKRNKNKNMFNNNIFPKEQMNKEKPIIIEHFIKEENDNEIDFLNLNNIESKSSHDSKKYYNLDFQFKDKNYQKRFSISSKNSRINLSSIINEIYYKKNLNKRVNSACQIENKFNFIVSNDDENNNFIFFNKNINEIIKKTKNEKINLVLYPKKKLQKIKNRHNVNKKKERNILFKNNDISGAKYKTIKLRFKKNRSESFFFREPNDMNQRNRFIKLKKDLNEEANKINNMKSEFFKGPLYNKFNKIDKIEDLRLKNSLKRPRSVLLSS